MIYCFQCLKRQDGSHVDMTSFALLGNHMLVFLPTLNDTSQIRGDLVSKPLITKTLIRRKQCKLSQRLYWCHTSQGKLVVYVKMDTER